MKKRNILAIALASTMLLANTPATAINIFSKLWGTVTNKASEVKTQIKAKLEERPKIKEAISNSYTWAKDTWNGSNILQKLMYGSIATSSVIVSTCLVLSNSKTLSRLGLSGLSTGLLYFFTKKTEQGRKLAAQTKDHAKKTYKKIKDWSKKLLKQAKEV